MYSLLIVGVLNKEATNKNKEINKPIINPDHKNGKLYFFTISRSFFLTIYSYPCMAGISPGLDAPLGDCGWLLVGAACC
jgi:hypothetical protein